MNNIFQWNRLEINLIEITLLIQTILPIEFSLQEPQLKKKDHVTLNNYIAYNTYVKRAAVDSTIFVRINSSFNLFCVCFQCNKLMK